MYSFQVKAAAEAIISSVEAIRAVLSSQKEEEIEVFVPDR